MKRLILCLGLVFVGSVQADVIPGASYAGVYSEGDVWIKPHVHLCFYRENIGDPKMWGCITEHRAYDIPTDQMSLEIPVDYDHKKHELIVFFDRSGSIISTDCMDRNIFNELAVGTYWINNILSHHYIALDPAAKPIAKKAVLVTRCGDLFFIDCIILFDAHGNYIYAATYTGKGYEKHASQFVELQIDQVEDQRTKGIYKGLKRLWRNNYVINKNSLYRS